MTQEEVAADIAARIGVFRDCLLGQGVEQALVKHVMRHECSIIGNDFEIGVRDCIATQFGVAIDSIFVVGSAKLGFSPKPGQYFKHFSDDSDIDVAIVSRDLYVSIWHEVNQMVSAGEYFNVEKFKHYHLMGWIRPDKMPSADEYQVCHDWWEFFREISGREEFMRTKIRGGLYYDERFLMRYQRNGLTAMRETLAGAA